ncbi:hypothetical protein [Quatrionicoccus australiensis]|uniref:hypothetical protein n=1 Tax=Quatrionicoccus australiensis TaxID=138118 RepID=UPI001CFB43ED|nr:hypothetical protein [Quatrionicoccus australiensis]MCB4359331.1 hypothetical protein [Quatrionicoccus australiensis]
MWMLAHHNQASALKVPDLQTFTGNPADLAAPFLNEESTDDKDWKTIAANFAALKILPDFGKNPKNPGKNRQNTWIS